MGPVIMCHVYKSSQKWGQGLFLKNKKFCRDQKQFFFFTGPKLKRGIFAGTSAIFKPNIKVSYIACMLFLHFNFIVC